MYCREKIKPEPNVPFVWSLISEKNLLQNIFLLSFPPSSTFSPFTSRPDQKETLPFFFLGISNEYCSSDRYSGHLEKLTDNNLEVILFKTILMMIFPFTFFLY